MFGAKFSGNTTHWAADTTIRYKKNACINHPLKQSWANINGRHLLLIFFLERKRMPHNPCFAWFACKCFWSVSGNFDLHIWKSMKAALLRRVACFPLLVSQKTKLNCYVRFLGGVAHTKAESAHTHGLKTDIGWCQSALPAAADFLACHANRTVLSRWWLSKPKFACERSQIFNVMCRHQQVMFDASGSPLQTTLPSQQCTKENRPRRNVLHQIKSLNVVCQPLFWVRDYPEIIQSNPK